MREDDPLTKLREVSRTIHEQVDRAYSGFSLSDAASYTAFLQAHGRVLPQVEAWLKTVVKLPSWRERTEYLRSDLVELGHDLPECLDWQPPSGIGAPLGVLYVLEGSRLGGKMLAAQVGEGLPHTYLSAGHEKGGWPAFLQTLRERLQDADDGYRQSVMDGVTSAFDLFRRAATVRG
ncbi:biliverdin-producing heme oxygenase [Gluconobacter japonicus]|uniref:biliverdin-producing heme oxygenase n=1 Tax=Gluconobacter japonicus TaxID=376620 RepID=UPI0024ACCF1B|nr:biliverdin-producing heme oxygenase [Gluconobacter japonicus]MDI6652725.1 biliverdin-producing heme oxygenase [Gluconobacter japonicus]